MSADTKKTVTVCAVCGSQAVQHAMWVNVNTDEVNDEFGTWCNGDNSWCEDCSDHTELVEREIAPLKKTTKAATKKARAS